MSLLVHPRRAFADLAERPACAWLGVAAVLGMALGWAAFSALLGAAGHTPSGPPLLPIPPEDYYAAQALFVVPVRLAMLGALAATVHWLGRGLGGGGAARHAVLVAGLSMAVPSVVAWLVPDVAVYLALGFEALAEGMRYYVPVSVLWTVVLVTAGTRAIHGLSLGRALVVALLGLLAHAVVGAPFLR